MRIRLFSFRHGLSRVLITAIGLCAFAPLAQATKTGRCEALFVAVEKTSAETVLKGKTDLIEVDGRPVFYQHFPAKRGKPTLLLFLGLFTPIQNFVALTKELQKQAPGVGIVLYAYSTVIESRMWDPTRVVATPSLEDMGLQGAAVVRHLGVKGPVVGIAYSYGAATMTSLMARADSPLQHVVFVSPLVAPGDNQQSLFVGSQLAQTVAIWNPIFGPAYLDSLRAQAATTGATSIIDGFLAKFGALPAAVSRELAIQWLTEHIRIAERFDLQKVDPGGWPQVDIVLGELEQKQRLILQKKVIDRWVFHKVLGRGDVAIVPDGDHRLLEAHPQESTAQLVEILKRRGLL